MRLLRLSGTTTHAAFLRDDATRAMSPTWSKQSCKQMSSQSPSGALGWLVIKKKGAAAACENLPAKRQTELIQGEMQIKSNTLWRGRGEPAYMCMKGQSQRVRSGHGKQRCRKKTLQRHHAKPHSLDTHKTKVEGR